MNSETYPQHSSHEPERGGYSRESGRGGYSRDRRGGRGRRHSRGGFRRDFRRDDRRYAPKPSGGIWNFFKRLFGFSSKPVVEERARHSRPMPDYRRDDAPRSEGPRFIETPQELVSPKLYIGNLAYETSESDLFDFFSQVGAIANVEIVRDRQSNSKGFGFIEMQSLESAKSAIEKYNGVDFMGRHIVVSPAKS